MELPAREFFDVSQRSTTMMSAVYSRMLSGTVVYYIQSIDALVKKRDSQRDLMIFYET
jgi:hypothetical protein